MTETRSIPELSQALAQAVRENERYKTALELIAGGFHSGPVTDAICNRDFKPAWSESQQFARAALDPLPQQNQGGKK